MNGSLRDGPQFANHFRRECTSNEEMKRILLEPDFEAWRSAARGALQAGFHPEQLDLQDAAARSELSLTLESDESPAGPGIPHPHTSRLFLEAAKLVAVHRDPQRWNLLYRILFRLQRERDLLKVENDEDVLQLTRLEAQVRRDLHAMQAFVRFRKVLEPNDPSERPVVVDEPRTIVFEPYGDPPAHHLVLETPTPFGPVKTELESCPPEEPTPDKDCEHFIAWHEPEHRIVPLAAPFFAERFEIMRWTILTPDASVSWDPIAKKLVFGPGVARRLGQDSPPEQEELEALWRSYYVSLFNPASLQSLATQGEFPVRPASERRKTSLLPPLQQTSKAKGDIMVTRPQSQPTAQPFVPAEHTLSALSAALPSCRGCDLYCNATQVVGGEGPVTASLMLVGEQPGDQEDRQGHPFVGPAGAVLDRVLEELRIPRAEVYVTNAVKHFKFVQRGKFRLHQNPRMSEITACRPWLLAEIDAIRPKVVLCLGASASKSLLGGTFSLMKDHGKEMHTPFAERVFATIHPSAVLRARDDQNRHQLRQFLADDLAKAWYASQKS